MLILQGFLLQGYIVSSPDYEGPDAAFIPGRLEGVVTLDSMRAVSNYKNTLGLSTSTPKIVGYGYSGGSVATGWAASLHQAYAPELLVQGVSKFPEHFASLFVFLALNAFLGRLRTSETFKRGIRTRESSKYFVTEQC
jgi:hypothetical protein